MSNPVQVELPTGEVVLIKVGKSSLADVGAGQIFKLDADQFRSTVHGVSQSLRAALEDLVPDQVEVEFGLEFEVKSGKIASMVAEAGAKAAVKVNLTWNGNVAAVPGDQPANAH